jgi:hypothetical protein
MTFTAHAPDGKSDPLLVIPNYNFSWQIPYRWEPGQMRLAKGTRLECVAHYDNSAFNPYNPNPKATVRNGPQTHHEMMYGFFFYTHADEKLNLKVDPKTGVEKKQIDPKTIEAYEKLGAKYGGWVKDSKGWEFERGEKAAENGLPGFHFAEIPKAALPDVAVPFGLYLAHADGVNDAFLKRLAHFKNLKTLDIAWTPVTAAGLKELAPLSKTLSTLGLTRTNYRYRQSPGAKITDKSLRTLREIGLLHAIHAAAGKDGARPSSPEEVNLIGLTMTEVTDAGLKELSEFKNLATLYLDYTDVTDVGLKELAALKNLRILHLQYTDVTDAGVAELQKALPNCKIER